MTTLSLHRAPAAAAAAPLYIAQRIIRPLYVLHVRMKRETGGEENDGDAESNNSARVPVVSSVKEEYNICNRELLKDAAI